MVEVKWGANADRPYWFPFSDQIKEWLSNNESLPDTLLYLRPTYKEGQQEQVAGRLVVVLGRDDWPSTKGTLEAEGSLKIDFIPQGNFLRIWGLPNCPDRRDGEEVVRILSRLLPEVAKTDPQKKLAIMAMVSEAYVKECSKRFEKTLEGTRKAIKDGNAAVAKLQVELVKKIRETRGAERKLEQMESSREAQTEGYAQEFNKLLQVPKVRRVEAKEGKVIVYTDVLFCTDPRTGICHEIGAFRIELVADMGIPYWFNLTRSVDGYNNRMQAPHIYSNGQACLGNAAEIFPELIGNYEFAAAAMVAIQFVESVNTDDTAGKHIDKWPVAKEQPVKIATATKVANLVPPQPSWRSNG